jgi:methylated-DNA-[protein]-cysteine S-methyltransferase
VKDLVTFEVDSPFGKLRCAATKKGLALVALPRSEWDAPLARLAKTHGPPCADERHAAAKELREYVAGARSEFTVPVDLELASPFARKVLTKLRGVGHGELTTYGALAADVGRPGGARAIGGAVGSNPVPVVVPCHRVVASGGKIGGFGGGLAMKRWLLKLEGVDPENLPR